MADGVMHDFATLAEARRMIADALRYADARGYQRAQDEHGLTLDSIWDKTYINRTPAQSDGGAT
jgi:hypothetical protein